jgi:tetratricopeptide (TPR) repeat protein
VDRGVIATANELFDARHFPGVVAMCSDALEDEPECVPLLVIRARAHIALRRDLDAQADLRDIIRLDPQCSLAYRLLGQLAARRNEHESAAIFFREALRLDPDDREANEWLQIVNPSARPAAAVQKLPAPAAAAGRFPVPERGPVQRARPDALEAPTLRRGSRFASGTSPPPDDSPTTPFARGSTPHTPRPQRAGREPEPFVLLTARKAPTPARPITAIGSEPKQEPVRTLAGAQPRRAQSPRPLSRGPTPELPGFGEYLVSSGILTRERLRAAQAYQRSMKVQLSTAIVTLGLASPQRIEWAAVAHQSQLGRA